MSDGSQDCQDFTRISLQLEDSGTKLNFLYDELYFGRGEAELEADPVLCEIHCYTINNKNTHNSGLRSTES